MLDHRRYVDSPVRQLAEQRLRDIRDLRAERSRIEKRKSYMEEDEELEEFFVHGVCCADPEDDAIDRKGQRNLFGSDGRAERQDEHDIYQHEVVKKLKARLKPAVAVKAKHQRQATAPSFSLRSLGLLILEHQKGQREHLQSIIDVNGSAITNPEVGERLERRIHEAKRSFYDESGHVDEVERFLDDNRFLERVRCLCPAGRRAHRLSTRNAAAEPAKPPDAPAAAPESGSSSSAGSDGSGKSKDKGGGSKASFSVGDGSISGSSVGTAANMLGTTSYGVPTFSGFGAARGWSLYDFSGLTRTGQADPSVLSPGGVSSPHRLFSPGIYVWYDSNNPAIHGVIIVDPSDLMIDQCGVCGGNGTTCLDCKGVPFGNARRDQCGVCYDPFVDSYDPSKAVDCAGVCNGTAKIDECGFCTGGATGLLPGFAKDCAGVCNGTTPEFCGVCGATQAANASLADCQGVCGGPRVTNKCGYCVGGDTGLDISYGMDCMGNCGGNVTRDCNGVCGGAARVDCTGLCGGKARINECKRCVGGSTGLDVRSSYQQHLCNAPPN